MPPRRPVKAVRKEYADAFNTAALNQTWLACIENPIPFVEIKQTPEQAEDLCFGCPLLEICFESGYALKIHGEVRGGSYWIKGRPVK